MILRSFSLVLVFVFAITNILSAGAHEITLAPSSEAETAQVRNEIAQLDSEQRKTLREKLKVEKALLDQQAAEHAQLLNELMKVNSEIPGQLAILTMSTLGTWITFRVFDSHADSFVTQAAVKKMKFSRKALITFLGSLMLLNAGSLVYSGARLFVLTPVESYKLRAKISEAAAKIETQRNQVRVLEEALATFDQ